MLINRLADNIQRGSEFEDGKDLISHFEFSVANCTACAVGRIARETHVFKLLVIFLSLNYLHQGLACVCNSEL